jgi:hypothetical protein
VSGARAAVAGLLALAAAWSQPASRERLAEPEPNWSPPGPHGLRVAAPVPLPALQTAAGASNPTIARWQASVARSPSNGFAWRQLADACVAAGLYAQAVEAYRKEAASYRAKGDVNAALIEEAKANGWDARAVLHRREVVHAVKRAGAKFEPPFGCYLGATVEVDPRVRGNYARFAELTGRSHAIYFDYCHYGQRFPREWAARAKAAGAALQIAWEPNNGLDRVRDDAYLQQFAQDAAAAGLPIFLRYACEMNGDWTAWSGNPARFIASWRTVAGVIRRLAPNVAMVWAPNALPEANIPSFYPGDEWVDWVGINFYAVHHHDNDPKRPALREDPSDQLAFVYRRYAERKPIMVCETAATHFCAACGKDVAEFGADKLSQLYSALPRRWPRVKAVCWYDIDNLSNAGARVERRSNNFSLTDHATILNTYRHQVAGGYWLSRVVTDGTQAEAVRYVALAAGAALSGKVRLSAWVRAWHDRPTVVWRVDGVAQAASRQRPYEAEWDLAKAKPGPHALEALVVVDGQVAARETVKVTVGG